MNVLFLGELTNRNVGSGKTYGTKDCGIEVESAIAWEFSFLC